MWKNIQQHSLSRKCKLKPQWGTRTYPPEWLEFKALTTPSAGKAVEQLDLSYVVGGSVKWYINKSWQGFPGGAVVENLPANAGDTGSSRGLGRSHMPRSNWAREPQLLSLRVWSLCPRNSRSCDSERPAHRDGEWPPLAATRESPSAEMKTQHSQK